MSETLMVECGAADEFGRRSVVATCGAAEYRDRFNADDAFRRAQFARATLDRFGWAVTAERREEIDALVAGEAAARDRRQALGSEPRITRISDVAPSQVEWLWPDRVPLGAITMLAGDPGLGKSFVTLDMAARVSRGAGWPDDHLRAGGTEGDPEGHSNRDEGKAASVVLFSAEDDLATTIRPRLEALGADCARIVTLDAVEYAGESRAARPFELARDLEHLATVVEQLGDCRLVVVDPISAYLGRISENVNAEVRALLAPLAELAGKHNLAVLAVSHLRKEDGAVVHRTMGSMAFVAAARTAWIILRDPNRPLRRLMLPVKNNLAAESGGLAYTIEPLGPGAAPVVCWSADPVQVPADEAVQELRRPAHRPDTQRQQVSGWLQEYLADGPQPVIEVRAAAEAAGFSLGTLRRAFRDLGGLATKCTGQQHGGWQWNLPDAPTQDEQKSPPVVVHTFASQEEASAGAIPTGA